MDLIQNSLFNALKQLFTNRTYLPLSPFKTLIQCLLRDEACEDRSPQIVDYLSIPERKGLRLDVQMVLFGDSSYVGSSHLVKLISANSVKSLQLYSSYLRKGLGQLPTYIKTDVVEANFLEVFDVSTCLSVSLVKPRQHRIEMTVEVYLQGQSFDDSINMFIRRILEEIYAADVSSLIINETLKAFTGKGYEDVNIYKMKDRRQQILSILKGAILNEGDITFEFYMKVVNQQLKSYDPSTSAYSETTEGFVHVTRHYRLSILDKMGNTRCFSKLSLDSIALGVFTSLHDADMYLKIYSKNCASIASSSSYSGTRNFDRNSVVDKKSSIYLDELITRLSYKLMISQENGFLVDSSITLLCLLCIILSSSDVAIPYVMEEVQSLTSGLACHICAVRDAMNNLEKCMKLFQKQMYQSEAISNRLHGISLSLTEIDHLDKLQSICNVFPSAIRQIRCLLLELLTVGKFSELQYMSSYILYLLWSLFDPVNKTLPVCSDYDITNIQHKMLSSLDSDLMHCIEILHKIDGVLRMIELSISVENYVSIMRDDLLSYKTLSRIHARKLDYGRSRLGDDLPRCLLDLLGFISDRVKFSQQKQQSSNQNNNFLLLTEVNNNFILVDYDLFTWRPLQISDSLKYQVIPSDQSVQKETEKTSLFSNKEFNIITATENSPIWEFYSIQGVDNVTRQDGIDLELAVQQEKYIYDVPTYMSAEGAKARYLNETNILKVLHEGFFDIITGPQLHPPFPKLNSHLFKHSLYLTSALFNETGIDENLKQFIFHPARTNRVMKEVVVGGSTATTVLRTSLEKLNIRSLPDRLMPYISGGVYGLNRVLCALGPHTDKIFYKLWRIPPIFANTPTSYAGMHIKLCSGITLSSATELCMPHLNEIITSMKHDNSNHTINTNNNYRVDEAILPKKEEKKTIKKKRFNLFKSNDITKDDILINENHGDEEDGHNYSNNVDQITKPSIEYFDSENEDQDVDVQKPDIDSGYLKSPILIELEVVLYTTYESSNMINQVRQAFAKEVCKSCKHMQKQEDWKLNTVEVSSGYETRIATTDSKYTANKSQCLFTDASLSDEVHGEAVYLEMQKRIAEYGYAEVNTAMMCADSLKRISKQELSSIFQAILHHASNDESDSEEGVGKTLFSADFKDVNKINRNKEHKKKPSLDSLFDREAKDNIKNRGNEESEEATLIHHHTFDPTFSDADRICADGVVSELINQTLHSKERVGRRATVTNGVFYYAPCVIRFTLLAQFRPVVRMPKSKSYSKKANFKINIASAAAANEATTRDETKLQQHLKIGSDKNLARLVASTLWISSEAANLIWQNVTDQSSSSNKLKGSINEALTVLLQTSRHNEASNTCMDSGLYCKAYQNVIASCILSQNYQLSVSIYRAYNCPAFKLKHIIDIISISRFALLSSNTSFNVTALGHTITRYVCLNLRYLLLSPQVAHLRGGCAYLLKSLKSLEELLNLAPISIECIAGNELTTHSNSNNSTKSVKYINSLLPNKLLKSETFSEVDDQYSQRVRNAMAANNIINQVNPGANNFEEALKTKLKRKIQLKDREKDIYIVDDRNNSSTTIVHPTLSNQLGMKTNASISSGDSAFLNALTRPKIKQLVVTLLGNVQSMTEALLVVLSKDMHSNFPELQQYISKKIEDSTTSTIILNSSNEMQPNDVMEVLLGGKESHSLEALISYAHRAETVMNRCLKDNSFYEVVANPNKNGEMEKYLTTSFFNLEIIGSHKLMRLRQEIDEIKKKNNNSSESISNSQYKKIVNIIKQSNISIEQINKEIEDKLTNNDLVIPSKKIKKKKNLMIEVLKKLRNAKLQQQPSSLSTEPSGKEITEINNTEDVIKHKEYLKIHDDIVNNDELKVVNGLADDDNDDGDRNDVVDDEHDDSNTSNSSKVGRSASLNLTNSETSLYYQPKKTSLLKLSRFHEEQKQQQQQRNNQDYDFIVSINNKINDRINDSTVVERDEKVLLVEAGDDDVTMVSNSNPQHYSHSNDLESESFSANGFKLISENVKKAAETKSMLNLLRAQGGITYQSIMTNGTSSWNSNNNNNNSVLDSYRKLPKPSIVEYANPWSDGNTNVEKEEEEYGVHDDNDDDKQNKYMY